MAFLLTQMSWLYREFGIKSVKDTGRDAWLIILTRCSRMFAYGTNSLVLALFFSALKFSDSAIGLFMSLTLIGDLLLSLGLTLVADRLGRRRVLLAGSVLMVLSGAIFAFFENYWVLLFAAVVGVISATGSDFGPFRAIEESTLSHLTTPETRADVLAWYVTTASLGSAIGTEVAGRIVEFLQHRDGWTTVDAYHQVFSVYTAMGLFNIVLTLLLSRDCELHKQSTETEESEVLLDEMDTNDSTSPRNDHPNSPRSRPVVVEEPQNLKSKSIFAQISRKTLLVMVKLWFLLCVDSLADGMTGYSLTIYYLDQKFDLPKSTLGDITSISYILSSCSSIFAGPLSRRLGLINTMVFTHLPSSTAVLLFPLPNGIYLTVALFFIRTALNNMDQAPRSAFIAAVVRPDERTAVMGITSMLRTLAATAGPSVTGLLAGNDRFWIAFVAAGALRICYDLGLFAMFVNIKLHEQEEKHEYTRGAGSDPDLREPDEEELTGLQGHTVSSTK
jgi:MFS family permease